jgi:hypothetical protein
MKKIVAHSQISKLSSDCGILSVLSAIAGIQVPAPNLSQGMP